MGKSHLCCVPTEEDCVWVAGNEQVHHKLSLGEVLQSSRQAGRKTGGQGTQVEASTYIVLLLRGLQLPRCAALQLQGSLACTSSR